MTPFGGYATITGTAAGTGNAVTTGAGGVTQTAAGANPTRTGSSATSTPSSSSSSSGSTLPTPVYIALVIAVIVVLVVMCSCWKCCTKRSSDWIYNRSHRAGPSMMPAYIAPGTVRYTPTPAAPYMNDVYDPVLERHIAVSPNSPSPRPTPSPRPLSQDLPLPMSPSPAYTECDEHQLSEGRGMYDPIGVHGIGSMRGRAGLG